MRTEQLGGGYLHVDLHLTFDENMSLKQAHKIAREVRRRLLELAPKAELNCHLDPGAEVAEPAEEKAKAGVEVGR